MSINILNVLYIYVLSHCAQNTATEEASCTGNMKIFLYCRMYKRPSHGDTEEDLLRMQQEFLESKAKPAAALLRKPEKRRSDEAVTARVDDGGLPDTGRDVVSMDGMFF